MVNTSAQRFVDFYNQLSADNVENVVDIYADDIRFIDPVHDINGLGRFASYLKLMYENVHSCRFDIDDVIGDEANMVVCWTMTLKHKSLRRGSEITVNGCSKLSWAQGRIVYHRDYFDLGSMVYEQLPIVGGLIKAIKKRIGQ